MVECRHGTVPYRHGDRLFLDGGLCWLRTWARETGYVATATDTVSFELADGRELRLEGLEPSAYTNDFQIVRGRFVEAIEVRGRNYLNFGTDWRTDFTVTIAPRDVRRFAEAGLDPLSWSGRAIRVRGWLEWCNGPMIEASHPEQIELLGAGAAAEAEGEPEQ